MQVIYSDIGTWKLISDIGLMIALCYMCFRFLRSPQTTSHMKQVAELDATLKGLIKEAGMAGNSLNDQLVRRQQSLEKLLMDLETAEQRANRAIDSAEEARNMLERVRARTGAESEPQRFHEQQPLWEEPARARHSEPVRHSESARLRESAAVSGHEPEAPSFESIAPSRVAPQQRPIPQQRPVPQQGTQPQQATSAARSAKQPEKQPQKQAQRPAWSGRNIYGELVETPERLARPLSSSIEREVGAPVKPGGIQDNLEEIYMAAEEMLKTGKDLDFVAARTKLPMEELKMLSQLIIRDQLEKQAREAEAMDDPRLGALGTRRTL